MKKLLVALLLTSSMLLSGVPVQAQTTSLRGQVVDELGAIIPGAQVTLIAVDGAEAGKERTTVANAIGDFTIANLPPGTYKLTVGFSGFQPFIQEALKLPLNEVLKVTLIVAAVQVETEVQAEANTVNTDPDQNLNATVLNEDFVKTLPENEDDLREYLQALAGPAAGGANGGQGGAQILVNGFSASRLPPRDAIMQIRINQNPYSAEYSQPGFGRVEIITKPGNDQWRGTFGLNFRNSTLDARNAFATVRPDLSQNRLDFNMSGPLIKKRMSFFTNFNFTNLDGSNTTNPITLLGPQAINIAAPSKNSFFNLRTDYLINNKNTFNVSYNRFWRESTNSEFAVNFGFGGGFFFGGGGGGGRGGGGFGGFGGGGGSGLITLPERASDSRSVNHGLQVSNTTIVNTRIVNEARLRLDYDTSEATARTQGLAAINVLDAFNGGGATCCPSNNRSFGGEFQDYLTYTVKKHTLKGGIQLQFVNNRDVTPTNFNGTYTFSSLALYEKVIQKQSLDVARGERYQLTINRGNPVLQYSQTESSWFANDDWRIRPSLTLSLGFRHEFQTNLDDKLNFAPRLGIAWSPFKDNKTTIRAGGGLFYSRLSENIFATTLRFNGLLQESFVVNLIDSKFYQPGNPLKDIAESELRRQSSAVQRILDPGTKAPYTISFNGSVERQLPKGLVGSVTYIYSKGVHQLRIRNINAPRCFNGATQPCEVATPDNPQGRPQGAAVGNLYQIESSARSVYNGLQLRLDRRMGRNLMIFSNYSLSFANSDSDGAGQLPADSYNLASEWGPSTTNRRHFLFVGGRIVVPKINLNLSPMITAGSGLPYNILLGQDLNLDTSFSDRPGGIGRNADLPVSAYASIPSFLTRTDPNDPTKRIAVRDFLAANYPNGVRAIGPGLFNVNMNFNRSWGFGRKDGGASAQNGQGGNRSGQNNGGNRGGRGGGGMGGGPMMMGGFGGGVEGARVTMTLSAQVTNILNRVNFNRYVGTLTSPYFGAANSAGAPRQLELGVRFSF